MGFLTGEAARIKVTAYGRLHFGLVNVSNSGARVNGGGGAMVGPHAIEVIAERSSRPLVEPVEYMPELLFLADRLGVSPNFRLEIRSHKLFKWHCGMGFHTQLRLSIIAAISLLHRLPIGRHDFASIALRGGTSGIGVHGFWRGGLLLDGGRRRFEKREPLLPSSAVTTSEPAPLVFSRKSLPFQLVIAQAKNWELVHGVRERQLFAALTPISLSDADRVARLVYQDLAASIAMEDFNAFTDALEAIQSCGFKRREIEYRGQAAVELANSMRFAGLRGVGMSSWGPTWFGFCNDRDIAAAAIAQLSSCPLVDAVWQADFASGARVQFDEGPVMELERVIKI